MRVGDLVRFKIHEYEKSWKIGLLIRYDRFMKIGEIMVDDQVFYVPGRFIETHQRGMKP